MLAACSSAPVGLVQQPPTREEVGASALPDTIAPVTAPFPMPDFSRHDFGDRVVSIADRGASVDALTTAAIQQAIDEVSAAGGGTVVVPAGVWTTGRIELKSNVNLHLDEGAELHFSGEIKDYRPAVFTRNEGVEVYSLGALVYANRQEHIAVTGRGKLVGPSRDCEIQRRQMSGGVVEEYIQAATPVEQRVYDGQGGTPVFLPMFVSPVDCRDVLIEGVTLENTPFWNVVPVYCDGVIIRGITVHSVGIPRGDGIDVESSRHVLIEYCTLSCGDDCFTMKAGRCEDGLRVNRPSENIVVRYCLAEQGHGGITCGSETAGFIRNLYVHDCVLDGTGTGLRFKSRRNRGGGGENLLYERIRMRLTGGAFVWDMLGSKAYVGDLAIRHPAPDITPLTPAYRNVTARDIVVEDCSQLIKAVGLPEMPIDSVQIERLSATCRKLIRLQDVRHLTLHDATIHSADSLIVLDNAHGVTFRNVTFDVPGGKPVTDVKGPLGEARLENFPTVNGYRNPVIADAMKEMKYADMSNHGVKRELDALHDNGNEPAEFDVPKLIVSCISNTYATRCCSRPIQTSRQSCRRGIPCGWNHALAIR